MSPDDDKRWAEVFKKVVEIVENEFGPHVVMLLTAERQTISDTQVKVRQELTVNKNFNVPEIVGHWGHSLIRYANQPPLDAKDPNVN